MLPRFSSADQANLPPLTFFSQITMITGELCGRKNVSASFLSFSEVLLSSFKSADVCRKDTGLGSLADVHFTFCVVTYELGNFSQVINLSEQAQFWHLALSKSQSRCSVSVYFFPLPSFILSPPTLGIRCACLIPPSLSSFLSCPQLLLLRKDQESSWPTPNLTSWVWKWHGSGA